MAPRRATHCTGITKDKRQCQRSGGHIKHPRPGPKGNPNILERCDMHCDPERHAETACKPTFLETAEQGDDSDESDDKEEEEDSGERSGMRVTVESPSVGVGRSASRLASASASTAPTLPTASRERSVPVTASPAPPRASIRHGSRTLSGPVLAPASRRSAPSHSAPVEDFEDTLLAFDPAPGSAVWGQHVTNSRTRQIGEARQSARLLTTAAQDNSRHDYDTGILTSAALSSHQRHNLADASLFSLAEAHSAHDARLNDHENRIYTLEQQFKEFELR